MYQNTKSNIPEIAAKYLPYFYQAGLFARYTVRPKEASYSRPPASDRFAASGFVHPFDKPQSVEQIIATGYFAIPVADPATALISDKREVSRWGLDDVIRQIRQRYEIFQANVYDLEWAKCSALNAQFSREAEMGKPSDSRQTYSLSKVLQGLYEQQREERVKLWEDVSKLRLLIPEQAQLYLGAYRKSMLLKECEGDEP